MREIKNRYFVGVGVVKPQFFCVKEVTVGTSGQWAKPLNEEGTNTRDMVQVTEFQGCKIKIKWAT